MELDTPRGARSTAWTFEALLGDGGVLQGVFGLGREVTERRAAEDAARHRLELEAMSSHRPYRPPSAWIEPSRSSRRAASRPPR